MGGQAWCALEASGPEFAPLWTRAALKETFPRPFIDCQRLSISSWHAATTATTSLSGKMEDLENKGVGIGQAFK